MRLDQKTKLNIIISLSLFLVTILIYGLSHRGEGAHWNYFVLLADAFLHGRLYLLDNPSWLNELIIWQDKFYVVYPPMPAILLMPFVALFGVSFYQPLLSILFGAVNVFLSYLVLSKLFKSWKSGLVGAILLGFGTMHWYHTEVGSAWYIAHIITIFFIWLMFLEIVTKQRLLIIGLLIGGAYLSRLPAILVFIFPLLFLHQKFFSYEKKKVKIFWQNLVLLALGVIPALLTNALYNYARFGVFYDISYSLLPIFDEPWYRNGLFSINNIPTHLVEIFTALPKFTAQSPYLVPSINVLALWFTTPALFLILFADFKQKIFIASSITVVVMSLPGLMHGSNGFSQFGFRFALDYLPLLIILIMHGYLRAPKILSLVLIILSILINLWGVIYISFRGLWTL